MKGHLRERSPGRWAIVVDTKDVTGKRKRRWHSFQGTKRQAQVECARLISESQGGGAVDPNRITVSEFLDRFERDWVAINAGARTAERYRDALAHVRRHLGDVQLQKVRPADIAALYATLSRSGLAPRSVQMVHRVFHRALGQAKAWGVIRDNVTEIIKPPPAPDTEKEILQPDQARELLKRLDGHPLHMPMVPQRLYGRRRQRYRAAASPRLRSLHSNAIGPRLFESGFYPESAGIQVDILPEAHCDVRRYGGRGRRESGCRACCYTACGILMFQC